jgi:glycerate 2-kinase
MVLVAPDSFKGTLTAAEVAEALARGLEGAGAGADRCPLADGGEGTGEALGAQPVATRARDPLGREIASWWGDLGDGRAVVEMAAASGLALIPEGERDPERTTTHGTGDLVVAAVRGGAREILVTAGGSATVDGGAGAVEAIAEGGGLGDAHLVVLCDVQTPWERAAAEFGPQKGASPDAVERLAARLDALAATYPRDPRRVAMTGAAGGLSGGLWAALGAELAPGAPRVLAHVDFDARLGRSEAVVTGEGALDRTTLHGKVAAEVAERAARRGVPCHAVVGRDEGGEAVRTALGLASVREAGDAAALEAAGRALARLI